MWKDLINLQWNTLNKLKEKCGDGGGGEKTKEMWRREKGKVKKNVFL